MNLYKYLKYLFTTKNNAEKAVFTSEIPVNNFYGRETLGQQTKRFNVVHYVFKYKFFMPLLFVGKWLLGKHIAKVVPDKPHYRFITLFDKAFDDAVVKWNQHYIQANKKNPLTEEQIKTQYTERTHGGMAALKTIKQMINTVLLNDDAYYELLPYLLGNITLAMNAEAEDGKVTHLSREYIKNIDPMYELVYLKLCDEIQTKGIKIVHLHTQTNKVKR